ncbi:MAG: transglycosylase SLT domain-containing protein [Desulfobacterales bacterium]|nr:transglycosylase SLT domain-containing protein [Desulfobacterales bacterium]
MNKRYGLVIVMVSLPLVMIHLMFISRAAAVTENHAARLIKAPEVESLYGDLITEAGQIFNVPRQILLGVILVESDGNPWATTSLSSAKGLMQTIDATFDDAWRGLTAMGISVEKNPFSPRSSILAGAWYLDRMYTRALSENRMPPGQRHRVSSWRIPLTYYYAGPELGARPENVIEVCSRGHCRTIDKNGYAGKVLNLAEAAPFQSAQIEPAPLPVQSPSITRVPPPKRPAKKLARIPRDTGTGYLNAADKGFD